MERTLRTLTLMAPLAILAAIFNLERLTKLVIDWRHEQITGER